MTPAMPHGTRAAYRAGCHCLPCKAASARARSRYRQHPAPLVPADLVRAYVQREREMVALDDARDPRADQVRDKMDTLWFALTLEELAWLDARS